MTNNTIRVFTPEDIDFKDDARHRTGFFSHVETWYYDGVFENGYSIVSLVNVIHIGRFGTVLSGIFIYKDGELIKEIRERYPIKKFYGSEETLQLKINDIEVVKGIVEPDGTWKYNINRGDSENGFNLEYKKTMKPFKGRTYLGKWLVIPRFKIKGTLNVDGKEINVKGSGYHDHNIYPIKAPLVTKGYFFGKISLKDANVVWAEVKKSKSNLEHLVMLTKKDSYKSIHPDNIDFKILNKQKDHRKLMPYDCQLIVDDEDLKMNVKFSPIKYHHIGILAAHYWRYHVNYTGKIEMNQKSIEIDNIDIAEYLKFF